MKIEQAEVTFTPITITFETKEEAKAFWDIVDELYGTYYKYSYKRNLLINISNKLSELIW